MRFTHQYVSPQDLAVALLNTCAVLDIAVLPSFLWICSVAPGTPLVSIRVSTKVGLQVSFWMCLWRYAVESYY